MKIGLVSAYGYAHPGGVTEHVRHLAAGLRRRGHEVTVFAPCSDRELAEADHNFIRVGRPFPIPMHGSVARITVSLHLTDRIKHYVRDSGFDVIRYHEPLMRSEEHTSELQSRLHLVCRLLLEKKKKKIHTALGHKAVCTLLTNHYISLPIIQL